MRVIQDDVQAAAHCGAELGVSFSHPMVGLVVMDGNAVRGAVVFNNFNGSNIDLTGVGVECWTVPVIRDLARYVFHRLRVSRVTAHTRQSNGKATRALRAMGFRPEGIAEDWFGDESAAVFGLTARRQRLIR